MGPALSNTKPPLRYAIEFLPIVVDGVCIIIPHTQKSVAAQRAPLPPLLVSGLRFVQAEQQSQAIGDQGVFSDPLLGGEPFQMSCIGIREMYSFFYSLSHDIPPGNSTA